jgi:microcin C transport system substrate-binding protein
LGLSVRISPRKQLILASALICAFSSSVSASEKRHGLSSFGDLKYPADFQHFDYVNPDAPKGGRLVTIGTASVLTFNSFNMFIRKDDPAQGLEFLFDSLMIRANDEPDAVYGLVAHSAELADDKRSVTFYLRPEAKFRDGTPVTAEDVVFSFDVLHDVNRAKPQYAILLHDVAKAEALDSHTVRYSFAGENVRDLPLMVGTLPILSKAYYEKVSFDKSSLDPPLGSGPYEIGSFKQGTFVSYKRRPDYWGWNLPVMRGRLNFDEIRLDYYRDRTAGLEAFKAGAYDLREEFTSKSWATEYNIPQVADGRIKLATLPDDSPSGAQGWFINTRRAKFSDPRVRKALDYAFDFEWTNKNLFYSLYTRTHSFFTNSDSEAQGMPSEAELKLLEPFKDKIPAEVFNAPPYVPPVSDGSGRDRRQLGTASKLLDEAGWKIGPQGVRVNDKGETLSIEMLMEEPQLEKIFGFYAEKLRSLGIPTNIRNVDSAQYQVRLKAFDFDIDMSRFTLSNTPGPEMKLYMSSDAAKAEGSYNLAGIADPVVDALIDRCLVAQSRDELKTAAHALDRVLRASFYWVPQWYKPSHTLAFWDRFSWPAIKPKYDRGVYDTWWYDPAKAAKLAR